MAQVVVTVNARKYPIACEDGQEAHLTRLGNYVDKRVRELVAAVGNVGDDRLLVMVSLLIADELSDLYAEVESLRGGRPAEAMEERCARLESLARRVEALAERFEHP